MTSCPSLPVTFSVLALKVLHPRNHLSPGQTGMVGHPSSRTSCDSRGIQRQCSLVTITGTYVIHQNTTSGAAWLPGLLNWSWNRIVEPCKGVLPYKTCTCTSSSLLILLSSPIYTKLYSFTQRSPLKAQLGMCRTLPLSTGKVSEEHP